MNIANQDKIKKNISDIYWQSDSSMIHERVLRVSEYVIGLLVTKRTQAGMIAILVGGFCLMLGLYIGLHIPR